MGRHPDADHRIADGYNAHSRLSRLQLHAIRNCVDVGHPSDVVPSLSESGERENGRRQDETQEVAGISHPRQGFGLPILVPATIALFAAPVRMREPEGEVNCCGFAQVACQR